MDLTNSFPSYEVNGPYDYLPHKSADPKYISSERNHYYVKQNSQLRTPLVSPVFASESDKPLPHTLIQVGDAERLRDENLVFYETFKKSPLQLEVFEDMVHVFQMVTSHFYGDSCNGDSFF